jgi:LCP family protein required for cell wall assembly
MADRRPGFVDSPYSAPRPQGWWLGRRFLLGGLAVVVLAAAATVAVGRNEITKLLTPAAPGNPATLLLVGDDRRPPPKGKPGGSVVPHSNEMLLVRLDPSKPTISMLSIPRDLLVTIYPRNGLPHQGRINTAYTYGGIPLMTETIKRVLGLSVNHVVVITFPRFKRAVNQMGCVYSTIDRRYFHSNTGAAAADQYFEINLAPGYQQLCGDHALQFVSYRHGDTALIRDARDQSFLRDVKAQYGPKLFDNRDKFEKVFGRAVQTDIRSDSQVLSLFELLVQTANHPIRQVQFRANIGPMYVTASQRQIRASVAEFLRGGAASPSPGRVAAAARSVRHRRSGLALVRTPGSDLARGRAAGRRLPWPLEYPRVRNQFGRTPDAIRVYGIRDPQGKVHVAYDIVIDRGRIGEYYDVQGTSWSNPPLLANPNQVVRVGHRQYALYYEGDHLKTVAWRDGAIVYWINNTLIDSVPPREMLAMAQQTTPVSFRTTPQSAPSVAPRGFFLPARPRAKPAGLRDALLGVVGFLAVGGVGFLAFLLFRRARELPRLRAECEQAKRVEARLSAVAAARVQARPRVPASRAPAPARSGPPPSEATPQPPAVPEHSPAPAPARAPVGAPAGDPPAPADS